MAHLWVEGLVSLYSFFELGSPRGPLYNMCSYSVSESQAVAFSQLVSEVLPFCRLTASVGDAGRGQLHFLEALSRIEASELGASSVGAGDLDDDVGEPSAVRCRERVAGPSGATEPPTDMSCHDMSCPCKVPRSA